MTREKIVKRPRAGPPAPDKFWTPARLRYWRDFDKGMAETGGEIGGYLHAGEKKAERPAIAARKKARERRTRKSPAKTQRAKRG